MMSLRPHCDQGYVLLPVTLMLAVVASVLYMVHLEGGMMATSVERELESTQARLTAESGYTLAKWRLAQNTSCTSYSDLPATSFGNQTFAATVSPSSGSPVLLSASGTMPSETQRLFQRQVRSFQAPDVLPLQPDSAGEDTYLRDGANKNKNFGSSDVLRVNNASAEETTLLRFDPIGLPQGARFISASLNLYLQGGQGLTNGVLDLHRLTQSWVEGDKDGETPSNGGATYQDYDWDAQFGAWATPGGDYDPVPTDSITLPGLVIGDYQWDVSNLVAAWIAGSEPNNGVLLRASGGDVDKIEFRSSDHSSESTRPKLTITYACECGVSCSG